MKVPFDAFLHFCFVALVCANKKIKTRDGQSMWILEDGLPPLYNGLLRYDNGKFKVNATETRPIKEYLIQKNDELVLEFEIWGTHYSEKDLILFQFGDVSFYVDLNHGQYINTVWVFVCGNTDVETCPEEVYGKFVYDAHSSDLYRCTSGKMVFHNDIVTFSLPNGKVFHSTEPVELTLPKCTQITDEICAIEFSMTFKNHTTFGVNFEPGRLATKNFREPFVPPKPRPQSPGHARRRCNQRRSNSATDKSVMNIVIFVLIRCLSILID